MSDLKFIAAMSSYAILALIAGFALDGRVRLAVWVFLGGIAVKTVLVVLQRHSD
jgi:hypothetical protein